MNGIINVYKPKGITSFDVVARIRKIAGTRRVGHTGTLDPIACGVLPVCIGKATKIVQYILNENKQYNAELKLGETTDTYDTEGKVIKVSDVLCDESEIIQVIKSFIGGINQIPPMYSAIKVNGRKLYELAREGKTIERAARPINIYDITINSVNIPYVNFSVICSKGTYIRSLCYDIGTKLGCGGVMCNLERSKTGIFTKETSVKLEDLNSENILSHLISMGDSLKEYETIDIEDKFLKPLINGVVLKDSAITCRFENDKIYRIYHNDNFIGLGSKISYGIKLTKNLSGD